MKLLTTLCFACYLHRTSAQGSVLGSLSIPSQGDVPINTGHAPGFVHGTPVGIFHIDLPGEHGNPIDGQPIVHQNDVPLANNNNNMGSPVGSVHVDMPGEHGNPIDGFPIIHREFPNDIVSTIGNTANGHGLVGNLNTGHLASPGTGDSLGDLLGIPIVDFSNASPSTDPLSGFDQGLVSTNINVVGGRTVQLTPPGRRRKNRRPKGGRNKKKKKGRRKKKTSTNSKTTTSTTTTTTTTTTPAPALINPGNGITIIRTSQPSPIGAFGDALRSALTGGLIGALGSGPLFGNLFGR